MRKSTTADGSYEWKAVATFRFAFGLVGLDRFELPPLLPAMIKDLRLTYQDLGNLVALVIGAAVSAFMKETAPRVQERVRT